MPSPGWRALSARPDNRRNIPASEVQATADRGGAACARGRNGLGGGGSAAAGGGAGATRGISGSGAMPGIAGTGAMRGIAGAATEAGGMTVGAAAEPGSASAISGNRIAADAACCGGGSGTGATTASGGGGGISCSGRGKLR